MRRSRCAGAPASRFAGAREEVFGGSRSASGAIPQSDLAKGGRTGSRLGLRADFTHLACNGRDVGLVRLRASASLSPKIPFDHVGHMNPGAEALPLDGIEESTGWGPDESPGQTARLLYPPFGPPCDRLAEIGQHRDPSTRVLLAFNGLAFHRQRSDE